MPKVGSMGLDMMFRTCTVQVNLDFESEEDMKEKLRIGLALQVGIKIEGCGRLSKEEAVALLSLSSGRLTVASPPRYPACARAHSPFPRLPAGHHGLVREQSFQGRLPERLQLASGPRVDRRRQRAREEGPLWVGQARICSFIRDDSPRHFVPRLVCSLISLGYFGRRAPATSPSSSRKVSALRGAFVTPGDVLFRAGFRPYALTLSDARE